MGAGNGLARGIVLAVRRRPGRPMPWSSTWMCGHPRRRPSQLYQSLGYQHWGTHPRYARVGGTWVSGLDFWKDLATTNP